MAATDQRIMALHAAIELAPDDPALRTLLAETLEGAGRWDDAVIERRTLVSIDPADADAKLALARAYAAAGQPGPAEVILDELEATGRMPADGWRLRGRIMGDVDAGSKPVAGDPTGSDSEGQRGSPVEEDPPIAIGGPGGPAGAVRARPSGGGADGSPRAADRGSMGEPSSDLVERPRITFADVGGMGSLKEAIRLKIVYPAQQPEIYAAYGQRAGGGLLLYGPPGCGKTHLARATAGEMGASFLAIGIADVLEMWIGQSERNLRDIFVTAREHTPCVLFFDEIDALAANRTDFRSGSGRSVINQFLSELDGVDSSNDGVLVLGATNAPWHLDPAFRRPGRFDDVLFVPPPDNDARAEIVRILLRDRPVGRVDVGRIVGATDGFSGADLRGIVDRAVQGKLAASLQDGTLRPLETDDLVSAAKGSVPTTREWFATVRNYVKYANQSGLYDAVRPYLK